MEDKVKENVRQILNGYLEMKKCRKTPERYAILDAVYSIRGHFTIEELSAYLEEHNFRVSRATLYNTIKLFYELRLVVPHHLIDGTKYEACYANNNHIHQICTVCGKVSELHSTELIRTIRETKLKRFRKDAFSLYIYGICSTCQAKITRRKGVAQKENPKT